MLPVPALDAVVPVWPLEMPDAPLGAGMSAGKAEVAAGEEARPVLIVPSSNP